MYIKLVNGQPEPYSIQQLYADNPNTSFPATITNELLAEYDVYPVVPTKPPPYDPITQNLNEATPVLIDGVWFQQWEVTQATEVQIAERKEALAQENKANAKSILQQTDWASIPSVADPLQSNPYLINQAEFITYRSAVRDIVLNPAWDAVFPTEPQEVWSNK